MRKLWKLPRGFLLIVAAASILAVSSSARARGVIYDKNEDPAFQVMQPKPNIQWGEPGDDCWRIGMGAASSEFDSDVNQGTVMETEQKQPAVQYKPVLRSYLSFFLRYLIWRM